jgi:hypothetical protein
MYDFLDIYSCNNIVYDIMDNDADADYRAKIILLRSEGYTVRDTQADNCNRSGLLNWPLAVPGEPHAVMNVPLLSNFSIRSLPRSTT